MSASDYTSSTVSPSVSASAFVIVKSSVNLCLGLSVAQCVTKCPGNGFC